MYSKTLHIFWRLKLGFQESRIFILGAICISGNYNIKTWIQNQGGNQVSGIWGTLLFFLQLMSIFILRTMQCIIFKYFCFCVAVKEYIHYWLLLLPFKTTQASPSSTSFGVSIIVVVQGVTTFWISLIGRTLLLSFWGIVFTSISLFSGEETTWQLELDTFCKIRGCSNAGWLDVAVLVPFGCWVSDSLKFGFCGQTRI